MDTKSFFLVLIAPFLTMNLHCTQMDVDIDQDALSEQLFDAIEKEDVDEVRKILDAPGFDVYEAFNNNHDTPLHQAALKGNLEIVNLLIDKADGLIDVRNQHEASPLHFAAFSGNLEVVNALLETSVDPQSLINADDEEDGIPLHIAAQYGHPPLVGWLIGHRADVNKANKSGNTPLHLATKNSNLDNFMDIATMLLQAGGKLYKQNVDGESPLDLILRKYNPKVAQEIEFLAAQPLFNAVAAGDFNQVKTLLENGYNPFSKNESGQTLLEVAERGQKEIADFLKELSTDPITIEKLTNLAFTDLIYYNDRMWTKKSLFKSALATLIQTSTDLADPFTRQALPAPILDELKRHFNLTEREYQKLIEFKKRAGKINAELDTDRPDQAGTRASLQGYLERTEKAIDDLLQQKGIR